MFQRFLHIGTNTKSFEDISEAQLENFLNTLTTLNVFFGERNNKGNKNVFFDELQIHC